MTDQTELEAASKAQVAALIKDRRRPGRLDDVNAELIPILRGAEAPIEFELDESDQTAAMRGLAAGLALSAPIWLAIAYLGSWLMSK